jgi:methionyl-tRNA formyltransferase
VKIIFAGTPEISAAVLQTLLDAKLDVIACLTQPDRPQGRGLKLTASPVKKLAAEYNVSVLQPNSLKSAAVQEELSKLKPDLMIVLAYGLILPQAVLDIPTHGCINIHGSILPRWRGAAPIQHAILAGDVETGITTMQMDAGLDTGDILKIYPCAILPTDTTGELFQRLTVLSQTAILDTIKELAAGKITATPQNNALATYAHKIDKQDAKIDWQLSAIEIDRRIRAYNPWPVAFTNFLDQTVRVWQAEICNKTTHQDPGAIIAIDTQGIEIATGSGVIRILQLQFPGKKVHAAADACHAHHELKVGCKLI